MLMNIARQIEERKTNEKLNNATVTEEATTTITAFYQGKSTHIITDNNAFITQYYFILIVYFLSLSHIAVMEELRIY